MKTFLLFSMLFPLFAAHAASHEMQHGFVLSADDTFASHLVATGHHSRQVEILGSLVIPDSGESEKYVKQNTHYYLFQAQKLDLPSLQEGQILRGHIVESTLGRYEPKNILVKKAEFRIEKILLNIENPFFAE